MQLPPIGVAAPDFTLPSTSGADVSLSALRGKNVLLAFFPLAFTSVCTAEMCEFTEKFTEFQGAETVILPISVDSIPTLKEFRAKEQLGLDLLSDFKREVSRAYGTLMEDKFYSNRAYVLIDSAGLVRWTFAEDTPRSRRNSQELLIQIDALG
ncbi:MAG TPA: redoxin domain-containing protein [Gemmatimonadales bacterium]|jgi:peroxiredoxin|nr:redoxin domain-containing protein [Gemmatimonadales bacterium]